MKSIQTSKTKYIFVTGGVLSSLGKGITSSSIATLLQHSGFEVSILKIDPYINVDPGTMSPLEHGEVFVTSDGAETDLDIGHYERFLNKDFHKANNFTTGQIYLSVIEKERRGEYLGKTIQIVPHIVDEIKHRIHLAGKQSDFLIVELGGTVGDMEGMPYLEAMRQLKHELGSNQVISVHVTLIPLIKAAGELKTKPTQHSVQELRRIGISPQILVARCERMLGKELKKKMKDFLIYDELNRTANGTLPGKKRIEFEQYVQATYFDMVILEANKRLAKMTENRYWLVRKEEPEKISDKVGLDLEVVDNYNGKKRDVKSLSGGEAFKATLSLALGLSDVIQSYSGGVVIDTLFIDEGFGSLDTESREQAINTLSLLIDNNKLIGIISHVTELKERIDKKIIVTKTNDGSKIEIEA